MDRNRAVVLATSAECDGDSSARSVRSTSSAFIQAAFSCAVPRAVTLLLVAAVLGGLVPGTGCKRSGKDIDTRPAVAPTPPESRAKPRARRVVSAPQTLARRVKAAIHRGIQALCRVPETQLRYDTALSLVMVRKRLFWPELEPCYARIKARALKDDDNPMNVLIDPAAARPIDAHALQRLPIPKAGQARTNVNHIVIRAVHCRRFPVPRKVFAYLIGPMRDHGGYHSTHALWSLLMMRRQGCGDRAEVERAVASLRQELQDALTKQPAMSTTPSIDLNAERILFLVESGVAVDRLSGPVQRLLAAQRPDGVFATSREERAPWRVHATSVSVWALSAVWGALPHP